MTDGDEDGGRTRQGIGGTRTNPQRDTIDLRKDTIDLRQDTIDLWQDTIDLRQDKIGFGRIRESQLNERRAMGI